MRPLIPFILCAAWAGLFVIATGCGESAPSGCTKDTDCAQGRVCNAGVCGKDDNSSSGGAGGGLTSTSSSGGGVTCTPGQHTDSECAACFQCIYDNRCTQEKAACQSNSSCKALSDCLDTCDTACSSASDYSACYQDCGFSDSDPTSCKNMYPSGGDLNSAVSKCELCATDQECAGCVPALPQSFCN